LAPHTTCMHKSQGRRDKKHIAMATQIKKLDANLKRALNLSKLKKASKKEVDQIKNMLDQGFELVGDEPPEVTWKLGKTLCSAIHSLVTYGKMVECANQDPGQSMLYGTIDTLVEMYQKLGGASHGEPSQSQGASGSELREIVDECSSSELMGVLVSVVTHPEDYDVEVAQVAATLLAAVFKGSSVQRKARRETFFNGSEKNRSVSILRDIRGLLVRAGSHTYQLSVLDTVFSLGKGAESFREKALRPFCEAGACLTHVGGQKKFMEVATTILHNLNSAEDTSVARVSARSVEIFGRPETAISFVDFGSKSFVVGEVSVKYASLISVSLSQDALTLNIDPEKLEGNEENAIKLIVSRPADLSKLERNIFRQIPCGVERAQRSPLHETQPSVSQSAAPKNVFSRRSAKENSPASKPAAPVPAVTKPGASKPAATKAPAASKASAERRKADALKKDLSEAEAERSRAFEDAAQQAERRKKEEAVAAAAAHDDDDDDDADDDDEQGSKRDDQEEGEQAEGMETQQASDEEGDAESDEEEEGEEENDDDQEDDNDDDDDEDESSEYVPTQEEQQAPDPKGKKGKRAAPAKAAPEPMLVEKKAKPKLTPFNAFVEDRRAEAQLDDPMRSKADIRKALSLEWKDMSDRQKKPFVEKAAKVNAKHGKEPSAAETVPPARRPKRKVSDAEEEDASADVDAEANGPPASMQLDDLPAGEGEVAALTKRLSFNTPREIALPPRRHKEVEADWDESAYEEREAEKLTILGDKIECMFKVMQKYKEQELSKIVAVSGRLLTEHEEAALEGFKELANVGLSEETIREYKQFQTRHKKLLGEQERLMGESKRQCTAHRSRVEKIRLLQASMAVKVRTKRDELSKSLQWEIASIEEKGEKASEKARKAHLQKMCDILAHFHADLDSEDEEE